MRSARLGLALLLLPPSPAAAQDPDLDAMPGLPASLAPADGDLEGMPGLPGAAPTPAPAGAPSEPAYPRDVRWGGRWEIRAAFDTAHDREGEDVVDVRNRLDLELAARLSPTLSALVSGRLRHDVVAPELDFDGARYAAEPELRDAYFTARLGDTVVDVGNQTIRWGSTDANSPNDVVNPADFREGLRAELETPLIPVPALRVTHSFETLAVEGVYVPFFVPHRAALFGSDWAPVGEDPRLAALLGFLRRQVPPAAEEDVQPLLLSPNPPDESPRNGSVGGRVGWRGPGIDLRLNTFYGFDRIPETDLDPDVVALLVAMRDNDFATLLNLFPKIQPRLAAGERFLDGEYRRMWTVGADAVAVAGDFAFKADAAWTPARTLYTEDYQPVRTAAVSWAGGLDYTPDADLAVTVEIFGLEPLDEAPADARYLFVRERLVNLVGMVRWRVLEERLTLKLSGQYGISRADVLVAPQVSWHPVEGHELGLGAHFIDGRRGSTGHLFRANDAAFARYALSF